jgi:hypothetical protein
MQFSLIDRVIKEEGLYVHNVYIIIEKRFSIDDTGGMPADDGWFAST